MIITYEQVRELMDKDKNFCYCGYGSTKHFYKMNMGDASPMFAKEVCRHALLFNLDQIQRCCDFLEPIEKSKNIGNGYSYHLKHWVESYSNSIDDPMYICNGSLIASAVLCGFKMKQHMDAHGKASFNLSKKSLEHRCEDLLKRA